jgi:hypothetical protein
MDFGKAFSYPFEDSEWARKLLIPALIAIIPIVGQIFLLGWSLDITRKVIRQDQKPLADLDFGRQIVDGLKAVLVGLVYSIPIWVLELPIILVSSTTGSMDQNNAGWLITLVSLFCGGIIFLYALLMAFVLPAAYANMVDKDRLGAAFAFNEVFGLLRAAPGAWLLVLLGLIIAGFIAQVGVIACVIGLFFTLAYAMAVQGHLYGQAFNESRRHQGLV